MKNTALRILDFLYFKISGIRIKNTHLAFCDMEGSLKTLSRLSKKYAAPAITDWEQESFASVQNDPDAQELADLFKKYGSDKSTRHNYYLIYAHILKDHRNKSIKIFEMGLGKPSASVTHSCASSRAFRDWAPKAEIYGADIEKNLLFEEDRIHTYWADQTDPSSLKTLAEKLPYKFDLIIDDGLHTPWANFNTIEFALPLLKEDGVLVVEDILNRYVDFWPTLMAALQPEYTCKLVKTKYSVVCIVHKTSGIST